MARFSRQAKCLPAILMGVMLAHAAEAKAADWHWDAFGTSTYSGQIALSDDQGSTNYQRYNAAGSPSLFGATSVQSPMMVLAGTDINFTIVNSGTPVAKPTCNAPKVAKVYVTPVTVCNFGQGNAIGGINAWAADTGATFTPHVSAWFQGYNWRTLDGTACGRVEVKTLCE